MRVGGARRREQGAYRLALVAVGGRVQRRAARRLARRLLGARHVSGGHEKCSDDPEPVLPGMAHVTPQVGF